MTISAIFALSLALLVLAIIPGPGIMIVVSRTLSHGLRAGFVTSLGIVTGDYIFITLAIGGLTTLAQSFSELFILIKTLGAAYLLYLGLSLMLKPSNSDKINTNATLGHSANFMAGLLTTMSNPKAILFYVSFFPAFLDVAKLSATDLLLIYAITTLTVGGVMVLYALFSLKGRCLLRGNSISSKVVKYFSGTMLISCGAFIGLRS